MRRPTGWRRAVIIILGVQLLFWSPEADRVTAARAALPVGPGRMGAYVADLPGPAVLRLPGWQPVVLHPARASPLSPAQTGGREAASLSCLDGDCPEPAAIYAGPFDRMSRAAALESFQRFDMVWVAIAVAIALPLAWFLWRRITPWATVFQVLGIAPFILPPVITALGFLTFWATVGLFGQFFTAIVSHAVFFVALPLVTLSLGFASIDRALVEAAATMGANERIVLKTVVLPLILPYLISGYAFAFVLSLNEYIVAYMTIGFTTETLPIKIFNALRYGYTPTMASVSVFFVVLAAAVFGLIACFGDIRKLPGAMNSADR